MIKLNRIKVSNFKNIKDADVNFRDFNVIVGPNNSGKSNFLQVLGFLDYLFFSNKEIMTEGFNYNRWGLFRQILDLKIHLGIKGHDELEEERLSIEIDFEDKTTIYYYQMTIEYSMPWLVNMQDAGAIKPATIGKEVFSYKEKGKTGKATRLIYRDSEDLYLNSELKNFENVLGETSKGYLIAKLILPLLDWGKHANTKKAFSILLYVIKSPIYYLSSSQLNKAPQDRLLSEKNRHIAIDLDEGSYSLYNSQPEYKEAIKTILGIDSLEFSLRDVSSDNPKQFFRHKLYGVKVKGKLKYFNWLSDGTLVLLALITAIFSKESSIIFIEEPENSIHPKALRDLLNFMREHEGEKQFIITTHSPIVVNMAKPEEIILAEINKEDGTSTIKNVPNPKELRRKLRDGFTDMSDEIFFYYGKDDFEIL